MTRGETDVPNAQRALWTVLLILLIGPFFGAIAAVVLLAIGLLVGQAPEPFAGQDFSSAVRELAPVGIAAFVWSIIPAAMTAASIVPTVLKHGTLGWFMAAAVGVIAFTAAILIVPFPAGASQPLLAFTAGVIALLCRVLLVRAGILTPSVVSRRDPSGK